MRGDEDEEDEDEPRPKKTHRIFKKSAREGRKSAESSGTAEKGGPNRGPTSKKTTMFCPAGLPPKKKRATIHPAGIGDDNGAKV